MPDQSATLGSADIARIMKLLPHRYPFLLIDRLVDMDGDSLRDGYQERHHQRAVFPGPFPRRAGHAGRVADRGHGADGRRPRPQHLGDEHAGKLVFFMSIDKARFRKP